MSIMWKKGFLFLQKGIHRDVNRSVNQEPVLDYLIKVLNDNDSST